MNARALAAAALLAIADASAAKAGVTGTTGGGQPFGNFQPSLAITEVLPTSGLAPGTGEGGMAAGDTLGIRR